MVSNWYCEIMGWRGFNGNTGRYSQYTGNLVFLFFILVSWRVNSAKLLFLTLRNDFFGSRTSRIIFSTQWSQLLVILTISDHYMDMMGTVWVTTLHPLAIHLKILVARICWDLWWDRCWSMALPSKGRAIWEDKPGHMSGWRCHQTLVCCFVD